MSRPLLLALPALLLGAPAFALTPEELWSEWQAQAAGFGVTLSAEAVPGPGGALTLRNWTVAQDGGWPAPVPPESPVQAVTLTPTGDGAVAIDLGLPASVVIPTADPMLGDLRIGHRGLAVTARDGADGIDYLVAAGSLSVFSQASPGSPATDHFAVEVAAPSLRFPGAAGADRTVEIGLSLGGFAYLGERTDPFTGQPSTQAGRSEGTLSFDLALTLPEGMSLEEMDAPLGVVRALDQGLSLRVEMAAGPLVQSESFTGFPFSYTSEATTEPGSGTMAFDRTGLTLGVGYAGGTAAFASPQLPLPGIDATFGPVRLDLRVPMGPEVGDLRFALSLEEVAVAEAAWAMLDPGGLLPREPIGLEIDLGGRMAIDLAAMQTAEAAGAAAPPPTLESLELRSFALSGAGLTATASGSVAFDSTGPEPVPTSGRGTARLEGVDRLLDALVAMGWITAEDARNARLGLAVAFRPGAAPDTREATVEMRADGSVWANGVQLQ